MSSSRGLANERLYRARILANSWRSQLAEEVIPATVLAGAFEQSAKHHLQWAYGWFLVEIAQLATQPSSPPLSAGDLPAIAPGKARSGELRELVQLEQRGWLADMLSVGPATKAPDQQRGSLALVVTETAHPDQIDAWIDQLQQLFDRMTSSLDEY